MEVQLPVQFFSGSWQCGIIDIELRIGYGGKPKASNFILFCTLSSQKCHDESCRGIESSSPCRGTRPWPAAVVGSFGTCWNEWTEQRDLPVTGRVVEKPHRLMQIVTQSAFHVTVRRSQETILLSGSRRQGPRMRHLGARLARVALLHARSDPAAGALARQLALPTVRRYGKIMRLVICNMYY